MSEGPDSDYRDTTTGLAMEDRDACSLSRRSGQRLGRAVVVPSASGQSAKWTPARTADGKPDLQGTFTFATITPLQRPTALSGKDVLSPEEAAEFEASENDRLNRDLFDPEKGQPSAGYPAGRKAACSPTTTSGTSAAAS